MYFTITIYLSLINSHRMDDLLFYYPFRTFFFISKNLLKSAEGRNPSTHEVYKEAPN
jgi:hypothetical protein